jgi:O-antigen ligase
LMAVQLLPLPPGLWQALPARDGLADADVLVGEGGLWRPISLNPDRTLAALLGCLPPIAMALIWPQLGRSSRHLVVLHIPVLACIGAVLGVIQLGTGDTSPFRFYDITNTQNAVGFFANRNHNALLLAMALPLLVLWHSRDGEDSPYKSAARIFALIALLLCFSSVIVAGSRAGLFLAIAALLISSWLFRPAVEAAKPVRTKTRTHRGHRNRTLRTLRDFAARHILLVSAAFILVVSVLGLRATAVERLEDQDVTLDLRARIAEPVYALTLDHFPVGAGFGTFDRAFRIGEPDELLEKTYVNHAHNDWIEVVMEGGLPVLLIIGTFTIMFVRRTIRVWPKRTHRPYPVATALLALMVILASIVDYPLRTPAIALVFTLCLLAFFHVHHYHEPAADEDQEALAE